MSNNVNNMCIKDFFHFFKRFFNNLIRKHILKKMFLKYINDFKIYC